MKNVASGLFLAVMVFQGAVGCGGTILREGTDSGPDAGEDAPGKPDVGPDSPGRPDSQTDALGDAGGDAGRSWSPVCPVDVPVMGSPCSLPQPPDNPEILCEYGKLQYDVACDTVLSCQGGTWGRASPLPSICQPDEPNAPACPATYADLQKDVAAGGSCSDANLRCEYPEGVCSCSQGFGGPISIDGGTHWFCNPGPGCPMPRPRLGEACTGSSQSCTYLTCDFAEGCVDGYWHGYFEACAGVGGTH